MADINKIVAKFCTDSKAISIAPCGNGLVNHTFVVDTESGTRYLLHKIKAIEAAVTFRLIERLIHNEAGFGCGEFFALTQY